MEEAALPVLSMLTRASDVLSHYVLPLYRTDRNDRPEQVGTCFIVRHAGSHYLVTAAHVLDLHSQGGLYFYAGAHRPTPLSGEACRSGKGQSADEDQVDVAVVRLDRSIAPPPYRDIKKMAVDVAELLPMLLPRELRNYLLIGFPATKNEFRRAHGAVIANAYGYLGEPPPAEVYERMALAPGRHLLLQFKQRQGFNDKGMPVVFPKPQGMSGGPIFMYESKLEDDYVAGFPIVGIATRHVAREAVIQGTDISIAVQFIEELQSRSGRQ